MSKCKSWWFLNTCAGEKEYPGTGAIIIPDSSSRQPAHELSLPDKELGFKTIQSVIGGPVCLLLPFFFFLLAEILKPLKSDGLLALMIASPRGNMNFFKKLLGSCWNKMVMA